MSYQEDVALAIRRVFQLGQTYWQQSDSESYKENGKSYATLEKYRVTLAETSEKAARADARIADMTTCALRNIPADWRPGYAWTDDCVMNVLSEYVVEIQDRAGIADARIAELDRECAQWRDELRIYRETENKRIAELERERNSLRDFANDVMESWPHGDVDGCDLERMAVEHGLLALKDPKPTEPCGDNCACSGYPSPEEWAQGIDCYVRTPLLKGDAARAGNGGEV